MYSKYNTNLTIPYNPQRYADEKIFVGRERLVSHIARGFSDGYSYGVIGAPGIGKTSLLYAVSREIIRLNTTDTAIIQIPVYLEFYKERFPTSNAIFETILYNFAGVIESKIGLSFPFPSGDLLQKEIQQNGFNHLLESILNWFYQQSNRACRLVLLLDDLHRGEDQPQLNGALSVLRPIISNTREVVIILAGELPLEKEFRSDVSPLRNLVAEQIHLGPLLVDEVDQLIKMSLNLGWYVEANCDRYVFEITKGHPYRIHFYLLEALSKYGQITIEVLRTIYNNPETQTYLDSILKITSQSPRPTEILSNQEFQKKSDKITILFLCADPTNASRLRLGEEFREIQEKIKLSIFRENFELSLPQMSVRPTDVSQALLDIRPQIVHFSGHGIAEGALCFEDDNRQAHFIQPKALADLFEQFADQVNCVVLNACFSEIQAEAIAQHIEYVIGMNQEIDDKAAIAFAIGFYQALGAGLTVEDAYKLGCVQIGLQDIPEHLTPVLKWFGLKILKILNRPRSGPRTSGGISEETGLSSATVTNQLNLLEKKGYVSVKRIHSERWAITALGKKFLKDTSHDSSD